LSGGGGSAWIFACVVLLLPAVAEAARIGDFGETSWQDQARAFVTLTDPVVRHALLGSLGLGLVCGLMGCFILVRRLALMGDTLSHAVLPGVVLGFLWHMSKDPVAIFIGAVGAGLLGTVLTHLVRQTTILKEDTCLGLVLGGFYGVGIVLLRMVMNLGTGNQSGLDTILFGQVAALSSSDVSMILGIAVIVVLAVIFCFKELQVTSFDLDFARTLGLPAQAFHFLVMLLLAFAVVVSLQAVGVVLVSAMLITPAATAYLLTDRLSRMLVYAGGLGMVAGAGGAFISYLGTGLPTGPFMVLSATAVFLAAYLGAPRHGVVPRLILKLRRSRRIGQENTLKAIFQVREAQGFQEEGVFLSDLAARRNIDWPTAEREVCALVRHGWALWQDPAAEAGTSASRRVLLTAAGWERACEVVRNHRLWELYLTNAAKIRSDHVHDDAEVIEHMLGDNAVRQLEKRLDFPTRDPHGKLIPGRRDMERGFILGDGHSEGSLGSEVVR